MSSWNLMFSWVDHEKSFIPYGPELLLVSNFCATYYKPFIEALVWYFTSQSTNMVMLSRSVHLTTVFPGQSWLSQVNQYFMHIFSLVTDNKPSWISRRRRMIVEIISCSISKKAWDSECQDKPAYLLRSHKAFVACIHILSQCSAKTLKTWGQWPFSYEKVGPFPNSTGP